ncbi:hypothetical protein RP20_CCG019602 [Aedes albopictus]|nr:hypothetical protein RP20_CCG019602 [Aedes albopictus]
MDSGTDSQQLEDDGIRHEETNHSEQPPVEYEMELGSPKKQAKVEAVTIEATVPGPVQAEFEPKVEAAPMDIAYTDNF